MNPDDKLIFLHLPKTAGTSLRAIIEKEYSESECVYIYALTPESLEEAKQKAQHARVIYGHVAFGIHKSLEIENFRCITLLRDPIDRIISLYSHHAREADMPYHSLIQQGMSLYAFLEKRITFETNNHMTRTIAGYNATDFLEARSVLDVALRRIHNRFEFVGLSEKFVESVAVIGQKLNWHSTDFVPALNTDETGIAQQIDSKTKQLIEQHNYLDRLLYEYVKRHFPHKGIMKFNDKIVVTGAAGLVGQNLIVQLKEMGYYNLVAIDKHEYNLNILKELHPDVETVLADLAEEGAWAEHFAGAACLLMLQAQITGKNNELFVRNNITSTEKVLNAVRTHQVPYIVHISSSVVNSVADDDYTNTKKVQEKMVVDSGIPHSILRPTLMFGWFDPKHLGWLSRFMEKVPVFPIPGNGRYMRQPLYNKDFCKMIIDCMEKQPQGTIYDVVGNQNIDYVDIIKTIKQVKELKTPIVHIPYSLFYVLLKVYALFSSKPPFTADQLKALTAGDCFTGVDTEVTFGVKQTPFYHAMQETFCDPRYKHIILKR
ncbi:NAD-dependent epimerase/dehydratase family protein [Beggiatoa leptomitoformis]|uniref:NAD-dependent epimerase/dehydratase family protein n=1 Tax=Beggiatoa leptomitoformis TaxID=288004 RepID=A0A650GD06_9GAMM|nr:NAD-dependent epimerase/dehydratase family protein [Beggiatoa leptomitoformis]QGX03793.1 NAD-dependent epimerase/dehydratase family protein [Beggiatoa leptomitoformis]QGX04130.1 NAD-dependent epimerase/dehydratase family protein [Beggiatoa leptomitoformis]